MSSVRNRTFYFRREIWLLQIAFDNCLTRATTATAISIAAHLNEADGDAFPSLKTIAAETNSSPSTTKLAIEALCQRGHIIVERGIGRTRSNRYRPVLKGADYIGPFHRDKCTDHVGPFPTRKTPIDGPKSTDWATEKTPTEQHKSTDQVGPEPLNPERTPVNAGGGGGLDDERKKQFGELVRVFPKNHGLQVVAWREFARALDDGLPFESILAAAEGEAHRCRQSGTSETRAPYLGPWLKTVSANCEAARAPSPTTTSWVFIAPQDNPAEWRAWTAHMLANGNQPPKPFERDALDRKGRRFPERWPPGVEPALPEPRQATGP